MSLAPTIERFGGGRDIRAWIQEVRRVGGPLRLSDLEMVAYAVSGMKKRAQQDWQALVYCASAEITTLEEVEATLLRQFDVPKTQLEEWEEWGSLRQADNEAAYGYCTRVQQMFNPTYLSEKAATACMLSRAKPELRRAVLNTFQPGQSVPSLTEMAGLLVWHERLLMMDPKVGKAPPQQVRPQH